MKQKIENYLYEQIKANLSEELQAMCVKGHTKDERPMPYIYVNVTEVTPYTASMWCDGLYNAKLEIQIADDFDAISYNEQSVRTNAVQAAVSAVESISDNFIFHLIKLEETPDGREDNNIIDVLSYKLVVNYIPSA